MITEGRVPRPTIVHDKGGVDDPHDDSSLTIDPEGRIWVYVAGRVDRGQGSSTGARSLRH